MKNIVLFLILLIAVGFSALNITGQIDASIIAGQEQADGIRVYREGDLTRVNAYIFQGSGYSMPSLEEGKYYICIEQTVYEIGDIVAYRSVFREQERIVGHRIIDKYGSQYVIASDFYENAQEVVPLERIICRLIEEPI